MHYRSGQLIRPGDAVIIDAKSRGTVVGCIDSASYLSPHSHEQWGHLLHGILVDTDFGGLVHYPDQSAVDDEGIELLEVGNVP